MTVNELLEDLLIEFDELDMQPMIMVPDPIDMAKAWKHELTYAIRHLKAEVAREILSDLKKEVHNKATYTHARDTYSFINLNTFDQIVNEMIRRHENHGKQEA